MKNKDVTAMQKTARTAGVFYLLQIPLGIFGILYVPTVVEAISSKAELAPSILAHGQLFRLGIVSAILTALVTVFTAVALFRVLRPVDKFQARLMVLFTVIAAPISMINELNHIAVVLLANEQTVPNKETLIYLFLDLHKYGIHISGLFWGLWLLPMGYLVIRSQYIPKFIGILLLIGGFGYIADFLTFFLFPDFTIVVGEYTFIGEVAMVFWLLLKGVNETKFQKYTSIQSIR